MAIGYTTVDKVASYLQTTITSGTTPATSDVEDWIEWAESEINEYVGHSYATSSVSDVIVSSNGDKNVWIPKDYVPLVSISTLEVNTGTDFDQNWVEKTEGTDFLILDLATGRLKFSPNTTLMPNEQAVKIDLVYGYSSIPSLVEKIATMLVAREYMASAISNVSIETNEKIRVGPIELGSDTGNSVKYLTQLNADIESLFKKLGTTKTHIY